MKFSSILLIVVLLAVPTWAQDVSPMQRPLLEIESTPAGALIVIDHSIVGQTPATLEVSPGEHLLRVSLDESYFPYEETIKVEAGSRTKVEAVLHRSAAGLYKEGLDA